MDTDTQNTNNKDYAGWHGVKTTVNNVKRRPFFHEREVWFASVGANIGFEQDGKGSDFLRPIVIIKKFNNEIFWGVPTTQSSKTGKHYFAFLYDGIHYTTGILSQLRLIDSKRLTHQIGTISKIDFAEMKKRLTSFLK